MIVCKQTDSSANKSKPAVRPSLALRQSGQAKPHTPHTCDCNHTDRVSPVCPPAGEGLVPEPQDEAQAAEVGGGVTRGAAEEEGEPAREPLEGRHAAAGGRGRRRHQR